MSDISTEPADLDASPAEKQVEIIFFGSENLQMTALARGLENKFEISYTATANFNQVIIREDRSNLLVIDCNRHSFSSVFEFINNSKLRTRNIKVALLNIEKNSRFESLADKPQVKGIFYDTSHHESLLLGLEDILLEKLWLPRKLMEKIVNSHRKLPSARLANKEFTKREQQILHFICHGYTNQDIATDLGLSEHTVKSHLYNMFKKHGFRNRLEACAWARDSIEINGKFPEHSSHYARPVPA